ncbi:hypothetical protein MASR2M50_23380 [Thauera sp.]
MGELVGDRAAFRMHRVGHGLEVGEDLGAHPHLVGQGAADLGHCAIGHRGEPDAARGHVAVVLDQGLGGRAIEHHALVGAGTDEAVAQGHGPQLEGGEQIGDLAHADLGEFDAGSAGGRGRRSALTQEHAPAPAARS